MPDDLTDEQVELLRLDKSGIRVAAYLTELSADATPALVAALPQLDAAAREVVTVALAARQSQLFADQQANGWTSWHLGRARAGWAIESAGITP